MDISDFVNQSNAIRGRRTSTWVDPRDAVFNKKPQVSESPKQDGGPIGFLQNIGRSLGSDFMRVGQGTANVIHELTGGAQQERNLQSQAQQSDIKFIKDMGQKIRSAKTDEERNRLRESLSRVVKSGDERDEAFRKRQDEIIEQNDPLKGAAAVGSIGLDVLGGGVGGNILKGGLRQAISRGLKQGAVFGGAQGALEPVKEKGSDATAEDIGGNLVSGAAIGAALGGGAGAAGKIISKLTGKGQPVVDINGVENTAPSGIQKLGQRLTESGSGLKASPSVGGMKTLQEQAQFMSRYKGTPRQQRLAMEKDMGNLSNQVDDILAKNPTPIQGSEVRTQVRQAIDDPLKYADVDLTLPGVQKNLESHLSKFESATTAKELNDYIKKLNPIAKRAQDKIARGVTLTDKEAAALTAKRAGDDVLSAIPEIKPLKRDMAQIFEITPQVAKAGEKSVGTSVVSGVNMKAPTQALKGVQSAVGSLLQGRGKKIDQEALATAFNSPIKEAVNTAPASWLQRELPTLTNPSTSINTITNPTVSRGSATMQPQASPAPEGATNEQAVDTNGQEYGSDLDQGEEIQSRLQQAALQALATGDTKGLDMIMKVAGLFESSKPKTKPLSAEASKVIGNANSGLRSLSQLRDIIDQGGGVSGGTLVPGRDLFGGLGGRILGTGAFDTAANNILDVITRLRTGAAITDNEERFYRSQIPQAFDSPEVREQKLQMFEDLFGSIANQTGTAGTDTQAALGM